MQMLKPSVQQQTEGLEAIAQPAPDGDALLSGPGTALWIGFGAAILIFLVVLMMIIRGRVIAPARRRAAKSTFFEPAGEDADISFRREEEIDEDHAPKSNPLKGGAKNKSTARTQPAARHDGDFFTDDDAAPDWDDDVAPAQPEPPSRSRTSPFSALFSKGKPKQDAGRQEQFAAHRHDHTDHRRDEPEDHPHQEQSRAFEPGEFDFAEEEQDLMDRTPEPEPAYRAAPTYHEEQRRADYERREAERTRLESEERARIYREAREEANRESEFERRKAQEALEQRLQSVTMMQRRLAEKADTLRSDAESVQHRLGATLEERFQTLSGELSAKLDAAAARNQSLASAYQQPDVSRQFADELTEFLRREIETVRISTGEAIDRLSSRMNQMKTPGEDAAALSRELSRLNGLLAERTAAASAGRIQLNDIVRSALPADRYAFSSKLHTGRTADCLITMPGLTAPVAVDAQYPVEAFDHYARAGMGADPRARTAYQQAILKHIVNIAEHLIAPDETADFAILFVPAETIFNDLHANFAELVQDSYRARVWILSPTSLMASLHMMSAVSSALKTTANNGAISAELDILRERVAMLEEDISWARAEPASEVFDDGPHFSAQHHAEYSTRTDALEEMSHGPDTEEMTPEEAAFEELQKQEAMREDETKDKDAGDYERPPFPLR